MDVGNTSNHGSNALQSAEPATSSIDIPPQISTGLDSPKAQSNASPRPASASLPSDEQSLTSFPALSPSLENSPESTRHERNSESTPRAKASSSATPGAFRGLITPTHPRVDRSALFNDTPGGLREIPGNLHLQDDSSIKHLISRVGALTLVKQLSEDLAERDMHVTLLQRKAEERERILKKMLRECEISNLNIETRLKQLERPFTNTSPTHGDRIQAERESGIKPTARMSDRISTAIDDPFVRGESSHSSDGAASEQEEDLSRTIRATDTASFSSHGAASSRGWKNLFKPASGTVRPSYVTVRSNSGIATGGQLQKSPPAGSPAISRSSSIAANMNENMGVSESDQATQEHEEQPPTTASKSVAAWALRLVVGNAQSDKPAKIRPKSSTQFSITSASDAGEPSASGKAATARKGHPKQARSTRSSVSIVQPSTNSKLEPSADHSKSGLKDMLTSHSPQDTTDREATNLGPVEMDTIIPEDTRPPTLLQPTLQSSAAGEFLTDSFGFIYDKGRRKPKGEAALGLPRDRLGSQPESLQNHHRPIAALVHDDEDALSVDSRDDLSRTSSRPNLSSPNDSKGRPEKTKRWQDYLKLSTFQTELLSHTPAPAPITDITVPDTESGKQQAQIHVSQQGTKPSIGLAPTPSANRVVAENAELVTTSASNATSPSGDSENEVDPIKALVDHLTEIHEASQREKTVKWNEFLRKIRAERGRDLTGKMTTESRARTKTMPETQLADGEVIGIAGLGVQGKTGRAKGHEFRNLVLAGIPVALRSKIWAECSGAVNLRIPGYYEDLAGNTYVDAIIAQQIQMDITRTLTDNVYYRRGAGVDKLKEVLLAYSRHNPHIGYCQGMNLITANLLLIMPTAEEAFWVLVSMIDNILPERYYDTSLLTSRADQVVLRQYVAEILPKLSAHLDNLGIELEALTFQWFLSVFTDCLSAEALFRVWDVVLCLSEGAAFLFQVALALLKLNETSLLKCDGPAEVYAYINQGMTDHAISIDNLIRASEGLKKEVRTEEILKRRKEAVDLEMEASRQREAIRRSKGKAKATDEPVEYIGGPAELSSAEEWSKGRITAADDISRRKSGKLIREESRSEFDEEARQALGELEVKTPMPIEEEAMWRG